MNLLCLENDSNNGVSVGITPGLPAAVSNGQCALSAAGKTPTLNVAHTLKSALPANIYLYASEAHATRSNSGLIKWET